MPPIKFTEIKKSIQLVSGSLADDFFPFSATRSVADIPCGILSIREKWGYLLPDSGRLGDTVEIPANVLPSAALTEAIRRNDYGLIEKALAGSARLGNTVDIIRRQDLEIRRDFGLITHGRSSEPIPESNRVVRAVRELSAVKTDFSDQIFIEPGAVVQHSILNAVAGPIYIGKNAQVMEGCMIRGPFALGEGAVMKMGSRIYGPVSIGPFSLAAGEIKNSQIFGNSNKAHEGYLGDSVIGEWCNLGAGTTNSNLKNSAGAVKYWNPVKKEFVDGGLKCGLFMGDYSRSAINTAFNTGTVVGVCVHAFGKGLTPAYLSSFTWGFDPPEIYDFEKAIGHIQKWMNLKNKTLSALQINYLKSIFDQQNKLQ